MNQVAEKHWQYLGRVLEESIRALNARETEAFDRSVSKFLDASGTLGLTDLAATAEKFAQFRAGHLTRGWNEEAAATLSFSMGALLEKMQATSYGPDFVGGLGEVSLYLDFFAEPASVEAAAEDDESPEPSGSERETGPETGIPLSEDGRDGFPQSPDPADLAAPPSEPEDPGEASPVSLPAPAASPQTEAKESAGPAQWTAQPSIPIPREPSSTICAAQTGIESGTKAVDLSEDSSGYVMDILDWYKELLGFDPASPAFEFLAEEFCLKGMWKEAEEVCRRGLVYHPNHLRGRVLLGWALWRSGEREESETILQAAAAEIEKNAVLYRILAEIADKRRQRDLSLSLMDLYHRLGPRDKEEPLAAPQGPKLPEGPPAPDRGVSGILEAWLLQLETLPSGPPRKQVLFDDSDREELRGLLKKALH